MSTNAATVDARRYRVRLIEPASSTTPGAVYRLLRWWAGVFLPTSAAKDSTDFVEGSYTRRIGDAGEWQLVFPNAVSSDGLLWRERFRPDGMLQFVELYRELDLEFVGVVERVEVDRGRVVVSGGDGWSLLKRAYERDRSWTAPAAEVVHAYSRVPVLLCGEDFADGAGSSGTGTSGTASVTFADGVAKVATTGAGVGTGFVAVNTPLVPGSSDSHNAAPSKAWRAVATFAKTPPTGPGTNWSIFLRVVSGVSSSHVQLLFHSTKTAAISSDFAGYTVTPPSLPIGAESFPFTLVLEAQGDWIRGFVNGELVGYIPNYADGVQSIQAGANLQASQDAWVDEYLLVNPEPFLQPDRADLPNDPAGGDYVSPGDLPWGGVRARWWNHADLKNVGTGAYEGQTFTPPRDPYGDRMDATVGAAPVPMVPGAAGDGKHWGVRYTGSVWIDPSAAAGSTFGFRVLTTGGAPGIRVAVGGIGWQSGPALIGGSGATITGAPAPRAGWYPFVVDVLNGDSSTPMTINFSLNVDGTGTYTDPGGTTWTRGVWTLVPRTALSPLGLYENRVQGQTHFDLTKSAAADLGYELLLEPRSLESGQFPGLLQPVARVGRDTDMVLTIEEDPRGTPILAPGQTTDGSELTTHVLGNAQGLNTGRGDVFAESVDLAGARGSLFMLQSWIDAGDIGFPELLAARLNAELALRATPWQEVRGNPLAQDRLADTFPLTGALEAFRWIPGDGIRVRVPDIGVEDAEPRRITQLSRTFGVEGRTGAQVSFRNRPRGAAVALGALARASLKPLRSRNVQLVTLQSQFGIFVFPPTAGSSDYMRVVLDPSDKVVRAYVRCGYTAVGSWGLEINGVDRTASLGGPWSSYPVIVDVTPFAVSSSSSDTRLYLRPLDVLGAGGTVGWEGQVIVEVLR